MTVDETAHVFVHVVTVLLPLSASAILLHAEGGLFRQHGQPQRAQGVSHLWKDPLRQVYLEQTHEDPHRQEDLTVLVGHGQVLTFFDFSSQVKSPILADSAAVGSAPTTTSWATRRSAQTGTPEPLWPPADLPRGPRQRPRRPRSQLAAKGPTRLHLVPERPRRPRRPLLTALAATGKR